MKFIRLTSTAHPMYAAAMQLYASSFPHHEQREAASQAEILSDDEYRFDLIYDGETFVGLLLNWETDSFIYIEHFCILPELRNKRYGQRTLDEVAKKGKRLILEIDPPFDALSERRKGFYQRCGFIENPYLHVHPPYHRENSGHELTVMSAPEALNAVEYMIFLNYLSTRVMND